MKFLLCTLFLGLLVLISDCIRVSEELKITLPHGGSIQGKYLTSHRGHGIRAFLGVPFAEPPVGELRFQPPVPKLPWTGTLDVTNGEIICVQSFGDSIIGQEDCLYANVYTPLNPKSTGPLPVMIFIHGGGFEMGTAATSWYPPGYLLDHDVVLVAANYRLGPLGFLSLSNPKYPGNYGLKDQQLLLQWVHDNIEFFNGDPRQVTLFGQSAGSASVGFHLLSKESHKLFHRAILQSGSPNSNWALDHHDQNVPNAIKLGDALGCNTSASKVQDDLVLIRCLNKKSVEDILSKCKEIFNDTAFLPTIEDTKEGFIQKDSLERSIGSDIPVLVGVTAQEGAAVTGLFLGSNRDNLWQMHREQLDNLIASVVSNKKVDETGWNRIKKLIREYYFKDEGFSRANINNVTDFYSDAYFMSSVDDFLANRLETNRKAADTFVFLFNHRGAISALDLFPSQGFSEVMIEEDLGVCHGDELLYLFPMGEITTPQIVPSAVDGQFQALMTELWVNFATTGKPTSSRLNMVDWLPARGFPVDYLRLGNYQMYDADLVKMEKGFLEERMNLWRQIKSAHNRDEL